MFYLLFLVSRVWRFWWDLRDAHWVGLRMDQKKGLMGKISTRSLEIHKLAHTVPMVEGKLSLSTKAFPENRHGSKKEK